ncbi:hypothetical protein GNI_122590 [Gregarina niphandrodes]|uniref:Uncharacterized protein n=1 Tax=Gregarina niphandrodes TaxID=110365 RepID=A0A023B2C3_GRENI|nr:hypothetical protein GNI_122590 [Gregarina niphandrodes]EZG52601.1 hypothetical protein GNI_122590 [Gregarina niphandrodes]|eukprot:XP_011131887.1 hypothetical protein GNI_122590 [Gregarina niphandrodes]
MFILVIHVNPNSTRYRSSSVRVELKRRFGAPLESRCLKSRSREFVVIIIESSDHPVCQDLVQDLIGYVREDRKEGGQMSLLLVLFTDSLFFEAQIALWRLSRLEHYLVGNAHTHMDFRYEINSLLRKSNKVEFLYLLGEPRLNLERSSAGYRADLESESESDGFVTDDASSSDNTTSPTADTERVLQDAQGTLIHSPPRQLSRGPNLLRHVIRQRHSTDEEQGTPPTTNAKKVCPTTPAQTPPRKTTIKTTKIVTQRTPVKKTPIKKTPIKNNNRTPHKTAKSTKSEPMKGKQIDLKPQPRITRSTRQHKVEWVVKQLIQFKRNSIHNVLDTLRQNFEVLEHLNHIRVKPGKIVAPDLLDCLQPLEISGANQTFDLGPMTFQTFMDLIKTTNQNL